MKVDPDDLAAESVGDTGTRINTAILVGTTGLGFGPAGAQQAAQIPAVFNGLAVEADDEILLAQTRAIGRRAALHAGDHDSLLHDDTVRVDIVRGRTRSTVSVRLGEAAS